MVPTGQDHLNYLEQNPDVAAAKLDPYQHFTTTGWREGRNPNAYFDTRYYLATNPDVKAAGLNPLQHFETYSWKEGRQLSLAFSSSAYFAAYPDVAAAGINPLLQFVQFGSTAGRQAFVSGPVVSAASTPDALVDASFAISQVASIGPSTLDVSAYYHQTGWKLTIPCYGGYLV